MAASKAKKQWTVLVYLAGDNNLDGAGVTDLAEMKRVGSTDDINVIAQFDRHGARNATHRYYLRRGTPVAKDVVATLGETNTGDPKTLQSFLEWGFRNYPAERTMVVLWNHGAGWDDENIYRTARRTRLSVRRRNAIVAGSSAASDSVSIRRLRIVGGNRFQRALYRTTIEQAIQPGGRARAIAFDDASKDFLDNIETKQVLASARRTLGRKVDILGMDACLMSMAEVCYQVRDEVRYAIGSEEVEPGDGWPYHTILQRLAARPRMSAATLCGIVVKEYLASYRASANVTQSACDLGQADALGRAIDRLARALVAKLANPTVRAAVIQARAQVQSYDVADYVDLYDLCELIAAGCEDDSVSAACTAVMRSLTSGGYIIAQGFKGQPVERSHGCAIYFPHKAVSPLYRTLDFAKKTSWDDFIGAYVMRMRRPARVVRDGAAAVARAAPAMAAKGPAK